MPQFGYPVNRHSRCFRARSIYITLIPTRGLRYVDRTYFGLFRGLPKKGPSHMSRMPGVRPKGCKYQHEEYLAKAIYATTCMSFGNISGKPNEHGSYVRTVVGARIESLSRIPCASLIWPYSCERPALTETLRSPYRNPEVSLQKP